jgi:hypothetical protein
VQSQHDPVRDPVDFVGRVSLFAAAAIRAAAEAAG